VDNLGKWHLEKCLKPLDKFFFFLFQYNETPLVDAQKEGHAAVVQLLRRAGGLAHTVHAPPTCQSTWPVLIGWAKSAHVTWWGSDGQGYCDSEGENGHVHCCSEQRLLIFHRHQHLYQIYL
jgi:hypothetical protein